LDNGSNSCPTPKNRDGLQVASSIITQSGAKKFFILLQPMVQFFTKTLTSGGLKIKQKKSPVAVPQP
ncbi:MAG: hypothetical protein Q6K81_07745, partial [Gloeomargarita sp. DG02_5_bins_242]